MGSLNSKDQVEVEIVQYFGVQNVILYSIFSRTFERDCVAFILVQYLVIEDVELGH